MTKTQQVNLKTAASLCGRSEMTIRLWWRNGELHPEQTGQKQGMGEIRLFNIGELETVNRRHGGTWHGERLPSLAESDVALLAAEVTNLRLQVAALRQQVEALRDELSRERDESATREARAIRAAQERVDTILARSSWTQERQTSPTRYEQSVQSAHPTGHEYHDQHEGYPYQHEEQHEPRGNARSVSYASPPTQRLHHPLRPIRHPSPQEDEVPPEFISVREFTRLHNGRESQSSTFKNAIRKGRLPIVRGLWKQHNTHVMMALDAAGKHRFWELWHTAVWFAPCPECPHAVGRAPVPTRPLPALPTLPSTALLSARAEEKTVSPLNGEDEDETE